MNKDINSINTRPYHVIIDKLTDELGDLDNPSNKQKVDYIQVSNILIFNNLFVKKKK